MTFKIQNILRQFPILSREMNGTPLAYLDNAASAQKPQAAIIIIMIVIVIYLGIQVKS